MGQIDVEILHPEYVKLIHDPRTGWFFDGFAHYETSKQTRSTQLYNEGETFTLKKAATFLTKPGSYNNKGVSIPENTVLTIAKASIEDNDFSLSNWYQVQIPGKAGTWYVSSEIFQ